jgi:archaellum component FlaC
LEQLVNIRFDAINDKFLVVSAQLDAVDVKLENFGDKLQPLNTKVDKITNRVTVLDENVVSVHSFTNDLFNNSSTSNIAISGGHIKTKQYNTCYRHGNLTAM